MPLFEPHHYACLRHFFQTGTQSAPLMGAAPPAVVPDSQTETITTRVTDQRAHSSSRSPENAHRATNRTAHEDDRVSAVIRALARQPAYFNGERAIPTEIRMEPSAPPMYDDLEMSENPEHVPEDSLSPPSYDDVITSPEKYASRWVKWVDPPCSAEWHFDE